MQREKVVLFHPRVARPELHRLPWPILQLAGNLDPTRFEVVLVDGGKETDAVGRLVEASRGALCCGISCFTGNQTANALKAARALRRAHPALPLVWGGAHPSMYVAETLADPHVDVVVRGQGEWAFAEICRALAAGAPPDGIPGVSYKGGRGEPVIGARGRMRDQDQFGRPPFELLDPRRYLVHIMVGARALTYHSSTGCPYACQFCTVNFEFDFGWSAYSAERVVDELGYLLGRAPEADAIEFADSNLIVNPKRTRALCQGLLSRGLARPWIAFGRPDQLARLPDEDWALLKESGCRRFFVGIESGDPEVLKKVKKEHSLDEIYRMAERMAAHGISADLSFTLGYPEDPGRDVRLSLALGRELKRMLPSAIFVLNTYTPYESTPLFADAAAHGLVGTSRLTDWETEAWRNFGFRKNVTPWMTPALDRQIRDFEAVAGAAFFAEEDLYRYKGVRPRGRALREVMIRLAQRRWRQDRVERPLEVLVARRLYFLVNPGLGAGGVPLVDGHQAGVKAES